MMMSDSDELKDERVREACAMSQNFSARPPREAAFRNGVASEQVDRASRSKAPIAEPRQPSRRTCAADRSTYPDSVWRTAYESRRHGPQAKQRAIQTLDCQRARAPAWPAPPPASGRDPRLSNAPSRRPRTPSTIAVTSSAERRGEADRRLEHAEGDHEGDRSEEALAGARKPPAKIRARAVEVQRDESEHDAEAEQGDDGKDATLDQNDLRQTVAEIVEGEDPCGEAVQGQIEDGACDLAPEGTGGKRPFR